MGINARTLVSIGFVGLVLVAMPAQAHFKLNTPADWLITDATGDPQNGSQKTAPCGAGDASNMVTKVATGSKLHVKLQETIAHTGWYRIALVDDRTKLKDPATTKDAMGNCVTVTMESTPTAPVLADGLFNHKAADITTPKDWETDVTMPATPCPSCTLQIIEVMTNTTQCFYHHCANLEIVDPSQLGDGGTVEETDGGSSSSSSSSGGTTTVPTDGGGKTTSSSGGDNGATGGSRDLRSGSGDGGCSVGYGSKSGLTLFGLAAIGALVTALRRKKR